MLGIGDRNSNVNAAQCDDDGSSKDAVEPAVLIRTPLCRKKVFCNELLGDLWVATRSLLTNRKFSSCFVDFWATRVIKEFQGCNRALQELSERCRSHSGVALKDVSETVQLFLQDQIETSFDSIVQEYNTQYRDHILSDKSMSSKLQHSIIATRNNRTHMEDYHIVLDRVVHPFCHKVFSIFMVFDGHNGAECAYFASKHLPSILLSDPNPFNQFSIREAFLKVQSMLEKRHCVKESIVGGTTVVMLLAVDNTCYLTWLGDSVAYVVKEKDIVYKTASHKPNRRDELERIERLGGCVTRGSTFRINGVSAVSRSLGDILLKPLISHEPEQYILEMGRSDAFVLASDGFADFCTDAELLSVLYGQVDALGVSHEGSLEAVCQSLVRMARTNGSDDNIMALLVSTNRWPLLSSKGVASSDDTCRHTNYRSGMDGDGTRTEMKYEYITEFNRPLSAIVASNKAFPGCTNDSLWKSNAGWGSGGVTPSILGDDGIRPYSNLV